MATATEVTRAYLAYFGRPPDTAGLNYWMGTTVETMTAGFAGSQEYAALYTGMTNDQRVEQVYQNLLGRASEPAGKAFWVAALNGGTQTVSSLAAAVLNGAQGTDAVTINNRVAYAITFTFNLTTAQSAAYTGTAAATAARSTITAITYTDTSLNTALATRAADTALVVTGVTVAAGAAAAAAAAAAFTLVEATPLVTLTGSSTDAFVLTLGGGAATRAGSAVTPTSGTLQASDVNFTGSGYAGNETVTTKAAASIVILGNGTNIVNVVSGATLSATSTGGTGSDTFNFVLAANLAGSTFSGGTSTDTVNLTTASTTVNTLVDANFSGITSIESLVLVASGAGGTLSFTSGANINTMAGAASLSVNATTDVDSLTIVENLYVTAGSLTTTSTIGNQTINIGTGSGTAIQTVTANSTGGTIGITVGNGADTITATSTLAGGNITITGGTGGDTISATTASTATQTITGGSIADTITVAQGAGTGAISVTGKAGADAINLGAHGGVVTIVYDVANQGGAILAATTATALAAGDVIAGTTGFKVAADLINVNAFTIGTHVAATSTLNNWNMTNNTAFVLTGATVAAGATAAAVNTLIGTVTAVNNVTNKGVVAIAVTAAVNTWNIYEVDLGAASTHVGNTLLAATDTISLIGTVTANGALTTANFTG